MMRAIRFATQLDFTIEESTLESIHENRERIAIVSPERIVTELNKIIMCKHPSRGFILLQKTGLLEQIFPELDKMKGMRSSEARHIKIISCIQSKFLTIYPQILITSG